MSLLDNIKAESTAPVSAGAEATPVAETKKKSNSEYQKKQREHQFKAACTIRDFLKEKVKDIPENIQAELDFLCKEKKTNASTAFGKPVFYKIFGNTPKVGDKVTALKIFEDTGKGYAEMRSLMKKWSNNQGITVEYDDKTKTYVIKSAANNKIEAYVE